MLLEMPCGQLFKAKQGRPCRRLEWARVQCVDGLASWFSLSAEGAQEASSDRSSSAASMSVSIEIGGKRTGRGLDDAPKPKAWSSRCWMRSPVR